MKRIAGKKEPKRLAASTGGAVNVLKKEWLPAAEAQLELGKSERSLQRLANAGDVRFQTIGKQRVYHAGDIMRVRLEGVPARRQAPVVPAAVRQQILDASPAATLNMPTLAGIAEQIAKALREVPVSKKLWLSMSEASEYSGLPRAVLLEMIRAGTLVARRRGKGEKFVQWLIRRRSLESV